MQKNGSKDRIFKLAGILIWILVWAVIALIVNQKLILAGPTDVALSFCNSITSVNFWLSVLFSFAHIFIGFCIALILGILFAIASTKSKCFHYFISPVISLFKSAPIVCFIVLLLIWFGASFVDIITVVISVIPIYYYSIYQAGMEKSQLIMDMLSIYKVSSSDKFNAYIWPNAFPFLNQATETGVGIAWKAGVTAQMIGAVTNTIGEGIYNSKLNLDSSQLIVWMFVVIILSFVTEKIIITILKSSINRDNKKSKFSENRKFNKVNIKSDIAVTDLTFNYNGQNIIKDFSYRFVAGKRYAIMGATGSGKTTLIETILGLHKVPSANLKLVDSANNKILKNTNNERIFSVVFQENTILPYLDVEENLNIVGAGSAIKKGNSTKFLPNVKLMPSELSGGMTRCVEILRAVKSNSNIVVMDEPFTGLDDKVKKLALDYIDNQLKRRTLIIVTHDIEDANYLGCELINI